MSGKLRIVPLGGLGEIGMNCMVLEYADEMLVIDCGVLFSDLDHFGVQFAIPDFDYIRERKDKLKGYVLTHGHEDHIGALPFALKAGLQAPVYCSTFTSMMVKERLKDHGLESRTELRPFRVGESVEFKHFKIKTVSVNHSIIDSSALIIETPAGKIVHTGDFKIDPTPFYGNKIDEAMFREAGDGGVLLLLSDSTNVERCSNTLSESVIYGKFEQLFVAARGLTIIAMFSSNVARMGQVFELARKLGKRVAACGRTMENNIRLGLEAGYVKDAPDVLIRLDDLQNYRREDVIVMTSGSQAEQGSTLTRIAHGEHRQIKLQEGDLVLMSSRSIPGNEKDIGRMINQLFKHGAEVLYEAVHEIHTSGHATRPELKQMLEWVRPKYFVPIHGEYRHLVHHGKLAREAGVEDSNVLVASNGDVIEVSRGGISVVERLEEHRVLVEGREGQDISKLVLKDRRQLGEKGVVFSLMVREMDSRKIIAGPEIITKGLANEAIEGWLVEEAKKVVQRVVADWETQLREGSPEFDLQETIRIELRRFFNNNIGKKPIVLPMILDL